MKNNKLITILVLAGIVVLAGVTVFFGNKLLTTRNQSLSPAAPESKPGAQVAYPEICDMALVPALDNSGSMQKLIAGKIRIEWAKDAVRSLIDKAIAVGPSDATFEIGIVKYAGQGPTLPHAITIHPISTNLPVAKASLDNIVFVGPGGATCIECGILQATSEVLKSGQANKNIILLTDGIANRTLRGGLGKVEYPVAIEAAKTAAASAKAKGIEIYVVAYEPDPESMQNVGTNAHLVSSNLSMIASSPSHYFYREADAWTNTFIDIATDICKAQPTSTPIDNPTATPSVGQHCSPIEWSLDQATDKPTPTATTTPTSTPRSCDLSCNTNADCDAGLVCSGGMCRNPECLGETDCTCPAPTPTLTATPTARPTGTPVALGPTPTNPPTEPNLPNAGVGTPAILSLGGGFLLVVTAILLAL